jgi:hypothetical protein
VSDPIVFVVDDEAAPLASLAGALERRFGADYRVLSDRSARERSPSTPSTSTSPMREAV